MSNALLGVSALSSLADSASQLYAAKASREVAKYNQSLYNIQAGIIEANQRFTKARFAETRKREMGKGVATLSSQNVGMGRTSLSLLNQNMESLYLDEAVSDYNATMSANQARSGGVNAMAEGQARSTAYTVGAANTAAKGISDFALRYKKGAK